MRAILDGDIFLYRVGFASNNIPDYYAKARLKESLEKCLESSGCTSYNIYLSDATENGFRSQLFPAYKANRMQDKPKHYDYLKEVLVGDWKSEICVNMEADDRLGIEQDETTIICSIDKDLHQIPGNHFNPVNEEFKNISVYEGLKNFYIQVLAGDSVDNITGCPRIGAKGAPKYLDFCSGEYDLFSRVVYLYWKQYNRYYTNITKEGILGKLRLVGRLVKIMQCWGEEPWEFPFGMEVVDDIWKSNCSV